MKPYASIHSSTRPSVHPPGWHLWQLVPDMRKAVNTILQTEYESKEWKRWFKETAKRFADELDASSDENVSE